MRQQTGDLKQKAGQSHSSHNANKTFHVRTKRPFTFSGYALHKAKLSGAAECYIIT